jgi:hypothetical protein
MTMNYPNDKPNLKREKTLKVPLNDVEQDQLRKFCTGIGQSVAPFVRDLVTAHIRTETNRTAGKRRMEWPRHGHVQRFPGRAIAAGGFQRMRL